MMKPCWNRRTAAAARWYAGPGREPRRLWTVGRGV